MEPLNDKRLYPALGAGFLLFRTTFQRQSMLKIVQVFRKEDVPTLSGPLMDSGRTLFDNRKVGTFPPKLRANYGLPGGEMVGVITSSARDVEQYCG